MVSLNFFKEIIFRKERTIFSFKYMFRIIIYNRTLKAHFEMARISPKNASRLGVSFHSSFCLASQHITQGVMFIVRLSFVSFRFIISVFYLSFYHLYTVLIKPSTFILHWLAVSYITSNCRWLSKTVIRNKFSQIENCWYFCQDYLQIRKCSNIVYSIE